MVKRSVKRSIASLTLVAFMAMSVPSSYAQNVVLPAPGTMVALSEAYAPPLLKGIKVYPDNPFRLDFILDKGSSSDPAVKLKDESSRLIKYFLASVTVPEKDLWVNLSPYEKDRIVPDAFGVTEMGRDLLAQDYMLKQITASVIYPEGEVGKAFWAKVYAEAQRRYGTSDVPVDTFNKVWIVPEKATVYENKDAAFVVESKLKVMLESDYVAATQNMEMVRRGGSVTRPPEPDPQELGKQILRDVVIPILEKEVNEGRNFARLRQVYDSLILAAWFKDKVKESIFGKAYVDRNKIAGVAINDKVEKEKIWAQYVESFKKGAYNLIREEKDVVSGEMIPRKYFSGGVIFTTKVERTHDSSMLSFNVSDNCAVVLVVLNNAANRDPAWLAQRERIRQKQDGLIRYAKTLAERFPQYPWLDWEKAAMVPWNEIVREAYPLEPDGPVARDNIFFIKKIWKDWKGKNLFASRTRWLSLNARHNRFLVLQDQWQSLKKYESFLLKNRFNYWSNQIDVRRAFLDMLASALDDIGAMDIQEILRNAHADLILGAERSSRYYPVNSLSLTNFVNTKDQIAKTIATSAEGVERLRTELGLIINAMKENKKDFRKVLSSIYLTMMWANSSDSFTMKNYTYIFGNHSFVMNFLNTTLRLFGENGISNGFFDTEFLKDGPMQGDRSKAIEHVHTEISELINNSIQLPTVKDQPEAQNVDPSMLNKNGGIDLTRDKMPVKVSGAGQSVQFKFNPAMIRQLQNAPGLTPVIIDIQPMTITVPMFLGLKGDAPAQG